MPGDQPALAHLRRPRLDIGKARLVAVIRVDEDEVERLTDLINEEGAYALEEDGDWYLSDTDCWVWGPLEVEDDEGNVRIVIADENGNMIDFKED
jgi:hypothetical protein